MFFKRNEGQFRETDRVTRFKLIKSGKHWLRASTSLFGLFKVIRGGVDTAQVSTEVVEERSSTPLTGIDVLKGIVAAGSVIGGGAVVQTQVHANEQTAVEKVIETEDTLVTADKVVLGTVGKENQEAPASDVTSQSISESVSVSESQSLSESLSSSVSASTSASESTSTSASTSTSLSSSESLTRSESLSETSSTSSVVTNSTSKGSTGETSKVEEVVADKDGATITYKSTPANLNTASASAGVSDKVNGNTADMLTTAATGLVTATETDKKRAEQEKKLKSLSDEIGTYLGRLGNREGAESALLKGKATIETIQNALTDPNADLNTLISEATRTRNSVVNTVLRASSGARDYRNGQALTSSNDFRIPFNTNASLGNASYDSKAKLIVTNKNQANYFKTSGTANLSGGTVTLTQNTSGQAGSYTLKTKIDMTESFTLTGKINLGNAYEGYTNGHYGGDGIATVFSTAEPGVIGNANGNGSGASLGMGGDNLKGSFGFKLDTWHNTGAPEAVNKASADPGSVSGGGAFGGFTYNYNGNNRNAQGTVYPVIRTFSKLAQNPTNNTFRDYQVSYNGTTKVMTVTYNDGQTWSMNLQSDTIATTRDMFVDGRPVNTNSLRLENTRRSLLDNAGNPEELALALFASTGSGTNLQQFRLEKFEYSARGAYVTVHFIDADTGEEIPGKDEMFIQQLPGTTVDLSQYLNIDGYQLKATNVATAKGYVSGNTVRVLEGKQGITYAFHKLKQNELYNATTKVPTVYTLQGEAATDVANVNNFVTVDPVDSSTPAVTGHSISWVTPISTSATGAQSALARVTYSDNSTTDVTINYTVYPKVETKTNNGVKGQFYAFKAVPGSDRTVG